LWGQEVNKVIGLIEDTLIDDFFPTSQFNINEQKKLNWEIPKVKLLESLFEKIKDALQSTVGNNYKVSSSIGQKPLQIAWSPWIGIHSTNENFDSKPKSGIYLTILWKIDGTGVCVSMQTGVDNSSNAEIKPRAKGLRKNYNIETFSETIDLASSSIKENSTGRPWQYEQANIDGKTYGLNSLNEIVQDLEVFIDNYEQLIHRKIKRGKLREEIEIEEVHLAKLPQKSQVSTSSKWKTSKAIRDRALDKADRKCEFQESHITFIDNHKNTFMEGHHLVPLEYQDLFEESLDFIDNIFSLCPTCHREIHYALPRRRKEMAKSLFQKRSLQIQGVLNVDLPQILSFYEENLEFSGD
jgi:5-methylcytosine-specific restriction endonuclease McrA